MKKILFIAALIIAVFNTTTHAQSNGYTINGKVQQKKIMLEGVSVVLQKAVDSAFVKIQLTNKNGVFGFSNIPAGKYFIAIVNLGYEKFSSPVFELNKNYELPAIQLKNETKSLGNVTVSSKKPFLEMKADKMVVNVDVSPSNAGNTALEVLEKSPNVTVDRDGNISLKGKQGVTVLLDGRPTYLSGADLANLLRSMNASQLDQIEIMTNPPAKFDASGNSGVINIKTKKNKTKGFNGNVNASYGQGVYPKANGGVNFNYRNNQLNIFGSINKSYREEYQQFEVSRNILNPTTKDITAIFSQKAFMPNSRNATNTKLGIDYDFNKKTSASFNISTLDLNMEFDNNITNTIANANGNIQTVNIGRTRMSPKVTNYSNNLNLKHKFDTVGTELNFDADYISYNDKHRQQFYNSFYNSTGNLLAKPDTLMGYLPNGFNIYSAKLDFTKPLKNNSKFEMGVKYSFVESDNNIQFDSIINGNKVVDVSRTNHFIYKEEIFAAYANYNTQISKKISLQTGLRYEQTIGKGNSITNQTAFTNQYQQLFPTVYLSYEASDKHKWNMNYGKRINRPQYRDMNPFVFIIDRYTFQKGNPQLLPQFSHNIELSHVYKNMITTTLNFSTTNGVISDVVEVNDATNEVSIIKRNIAKRDQIGLAVNVYLPLNKTVTLITNANVFHNRFTGKVNNTEADLSMVGANFYSALQLKLGKGWDAEVNGFFNTKNLDGITVNGTMGAISFAASKSVLKNKGKLSLNVRDPFLLQYYRGVTKFDNVDGSLRNQWDNRQVILSFNYRFGKTFKTKNRSTGSASEEQRRIGG